MSTDFDGWIAALNPPDPEDRGELPVGVMEILRAVFEERGALSPAELDEIFEPLAIDLADEAIALFSADLHRTTTLAPVIERYRDEEGSLVVSWNGSYNTPVFHAMRAPEATCEVADNLRDHAVADLGAAWPLCPTHGFGLYPEPIDGQATWYCRYAAHAVSTVGQLPATAAARMG